MSAQNGGGPPGLGRIATYRAIHASRPDYGLSSERMVHLIAPHVRRIAPRALIDYGCGRSRAALALGEMQDCTVFRWDPAIEALADRPAGLDQVPYEQRMVLCTYVLHHVPENELDDVLAFLRGLAPAAFLAVPLRESPTLAPSGDQLETLVQPAVWWLGRILTHFPAAISVQSRHRDEACFATTGHLDP